MFKRYLNLLFACFVILTGFLWLAGSLLNGFLSDTYTLISGSLFVFFILLTLIKKVAKTTRIEKYLDHYNRLCDETIQKINDTGFHATKKFIGSERMLMIDEEHETWYLMNRFYKPEETKIYRFSDIQRVEKSLNEGYVPLNDLLITSNGKIIEPADKLNYYINEGVLIRLSRDAGGEVFVNCYKTAYDAENIVNYFNGILQQRDAAAVQK